MSAVDRGIEALISQSASGFRVFIDDEFVATAVLRFDVASRTASAIRDMLPLEATLMHVTCSGEGVFFPVDKELAIDTMPGRAGSDGVTDGGVVVHGPRLVQPENLTVYLSQGDFVLTPDKACIIAYGRRCVVRSYVGDLPSNAFAYIRDPDDLDRLEMLAKRTLKDGAKTIRLEPETTR
ncbi:MAG: DUF3830 family protein [Acidimicrobiia bacterium]|nr:DUF3830 family protein [Acidimicrobiia bacterium]